MEGSSSTAYRGVDKQDLKELLEVFGSACSLQDIASAYCQARWDKNLAAEILCGMHETTITMLGAENAPPSKWTSGLESELASDYDLEKASDGQKQTKELKSKKCSASMGTVSSIIGKEYANPRPLTNECVEAKKPLKLKSKHFPASEIWSEEKPSSMTTRVNPPRADIEEFLFKMLGDGFQLEMPVIQEVLGLCGYDMQKSIDELLDFLASTLGKCEDVGVAPENSTGKCLEREFVSLQEQMQQIDSAQSDGAELMVRNLTSSPQKVKDRIDLQKEVLQALFDVPERSEEAPKRTNRGRRVVKKSKSFSKQVEESPKDDSTREHRPSAAEPHTVAGEEDDNSYEVLRTAVREHWITMKEYYKAAVDAFVKGDHARAQKLLEQGKRFNKKAREADDRSWEKIIEVPREKSVMSLDLHDFEPKEALSINYLRVIVESNNEDTKKGARKRLILKQLEKESIKWNEEDGGRTIAIQIDVIDPKRLSFAKKHGVGDESEKGYNF